MSLDRRALVGSLAAASLGRAAAAEEAGRDAGQAQRVALDQESWREAQALPGIFRLGARRGDAVLVEMFDYSCEFCRRAARDLAALVAADPLLRLLLVNYPLLGPPSAAAARVSLAVMSDWPEAFPAFHRDLFAHRGAIGAAEALAVAAAHGVDADEAARLAETDAVGAALSAAAAFGARLGFDATPVYLVGRPASVGQALIGYAAPARLSAEIAAARAR